MYVQSLAFPYSTLSKRFTALVIDFCILFAIGLIAGIIVPVAGSILIWFFYAPVLEASELRATLGKHMMGIQVTDLNGERISFKASFIRNIVKCVSSLVLFIGFVFAFFSPKKQTLHDMLADTLVVDGTVDRPFGETWLAAIKSLFDSGFGEKKSSSLSDLERLQNLRERGALTEEEFQMQKRKVLGMDV